MTMQQESVQRNYRVIATGPRQPQKKPDAREREQQPGHRLAKLLMPQTYEAGMALERAQRPHTPSDSVE